MTDDATLLDLAHAAMSAAPGNDGARRAFLGSILRSELYLMLLREAEGDRVEPQVFPLDDGPVVLAFDREDRMAAFAGRAVPYAALPGRVLVAMLASSGLGLGLNLEVAPSAEVLDPAAVAWLAERLDDLARLAPEAAGLDPEALSAPEAAGQALAPVLTEAIGALAGQGEGARAFLVSAPLEGGGRGPLVVVVGAPLALEAPLARALAEAALFGAQAAAGSAPAVAFLEPGHPLARAAAARGLALRPPSPPAPPFPAPAPPPGSDPARPPILRTGGRGGGVE